MFVMLSAIMIGAIIITYFVADIANRSKIDTLTVEIKNINIRTENFTSYFIKSSVVLDMAREDRAFGNYHFDLAFLWYRSALAEDNQTLFGLYKTWGTDNCTEAMPNYYNAKLNFDEANLYFKETKNYTASDKYQIVLDLYRNLTSSGSRLAMLRYNASKYLTYLTENMTYNAESNNVTFLVDMTEMLALFEDTIDSYDAENEIYEGIQEEIDEYEFFDEER
jgi:hypothetical protein